MSPVCRCSVWLAVLLTVPGAVSRTAAADAGIRFNRDIRPVLSDACFACHGPDAAKRKGRLRLDLRDVALERGAIVPGDPAASGVIQRLRSTDSEERMPPPDSHKVLTGAQLGLLERWIREGATYEAHWSYLPVERPAIPSVTGPGPVRTPVDAFVLARLEAAGLGFAPEAGRRELLRRLSLDLIGLPPSPEEVRRFVEDPAGDAYEREVERLLASPHFGERMAVPWLDAVRFADTVGYHGDQSQRIFPYRDYVIDAFNANKPFDEFTVEQIAGDLLPEPTTEQRVASGFNRLNMMTREGGAQPGEYLAKYQADRVRTVSTAWLGVTLACAECHDHKYDPFTTRDFYALSAFFADIRQWGVYNDYGYTPNPDLAGWSNDHPFPPEIEVESRHLRQRLERLVASERDLYAEAAAAWRTNAAVRDGFRSWRNEVRHLLETHPDGWLPAALVHAEIRQGDRFIPTEDIAAEPDGSLRVAADAPTHDRLTFEVPPGWIAALRLELLPSPRSGTIFRGDRSAATVQLKASRRKGDGPWESVSFSWADADAKAPRYANTREILGIQGGWMTLPERARMRQAATWILERPFRAEAGEQLQVDLPGNTARRWRISVSPVAPDRNPPSKVMATLRQGFAEDAGLWDPVVHAAFHRSTGHDPDWLSRARALDSEIRECRGGRAWTQVTVATNAMVTRVLPRGNWMDSSGEVVEPATPGFLPPVDRGAGGNPGRLTRLDLARWLVSAGNPLTPRHFANRLWAQFFGAGISGRIEDLGLQGESPSHPELLDWLAAEFRQPQFVPAHGTSGTPHPWDVKHLVRVLVNSATYRQGSQPTTAALAADPQNRLWSRQNPRRLEAEFVRDNALAVAGLLDREVGGPSAFPYQPPGYYANLQFPDRDYVPSRDERQYRRGVYTHWQRTFLHPMLANFDAPSREECTVSRLVSNTPQQALTLLNDPSFVEAARVLGRRVMREAPSDAARVDRLYERVLARRPREAERRSLLALVASQREAYAGRPGDARALAATDADPVEAAVWVNAARVLLNLHETLTRY